MKRKRWDRASIVAFIQGYEAEHGSPPTQSAVNPTLAENFAKGCERRARTFRAMVHEYRTRGYPSLTTIQDHFGTFNRAIEEAGYTPRKAGRQPRVLSLVPVTEEDVGAAIDAYYEADLDGDIGARVAALYELADAAASLAASLAQGRRVA